ncbi:carboxylesterase/lipase family protein [Mycobacterium yunnanensis]|uniref:Carboxylic ester hydrolase n=1 Tax=Mycobacterium yunnanensis TaxID=368477 RepID=A0A9X2YSJ7_9MYCO|nr:carboxylesterase family protein [Mycobacterium yunnanensis]MCV7424708.1 carboxylesterase/lipase family protein [Mycobacterium yunnanensis]
MDDDVLVLPAGRIRVCREGSMIRATGLRYAVARRFTPCEPVPPSDEVVDATTRGPACPQLPSRLAFVVGTSPTVLTQDEDCLVLDVVAPPLGGVPKPVMVFFHGGAYVTGSGQSPIHDLTAMAEEGDVVTVTVNYRLGVFGYLAVDDVAPANLGLLDQIAALRWVRDNVGGFGGDPEDVTIFGQSAGADSVSYLMIADGTEGLFRRVVLQSAPLGIQRGRAAMSAAMGTAARTALGPDPHTADTRDLLVAQGRIAAAAAAFGTQAQMPFGPQTGHYPLPPEDAVDERRREVAARLPMMIGTTVDDARPFVMLNPRLAPMFGAPVVGATARRMLGTIASKRLFAEPSEALAARHRDAGGHATTYVFDWRPAGSALGACHCLELPFLMGSLDGWGTPPMLGADPQRALAQWGPPMRRLWWEFARGRRDDVDGHLRLPVR